MLRGFILFKLLGQNKSKSSISTEPKIVSINSCEGCQKLNGRMLTIDEALREKPIPYQNCSHEIEKGKPGWCLCHYQPVFKDDLQ